MRLAFRSWSPLPWLRESPPRRKSHPPPQQEVMTPPEETLSLSRTGLTRVPDCMLEKRSLKHLYLEGNHLSTIPPSFFSSLPSLMWLDLRNNRIASLPPQVGSHRSLKTLLLEGNPISQLPPELGHVISLSGLNLRYCPITFPPPDVVNQGIRSILQYLRGVLAERPLGGSATPPLDVAVVEKLQLVESSGEEQEPVDEEELQRFRALKHRMILLDEAELGSGAPRNNTRLLPANRKMAASGAGLIPELPLFDDLRLKKPERRRTGKKQTLPERSRRCLETPHDWPSPSKITQERGISKTWEPETQRKGEDVQRDLTPLVKDSNDSPKHPPEKTRPAHMLGQQIRSLDYGMQEGRRNPRRTSTQQMAPAQRGVREMRGLQARFSEKNQRWGEHRVDTAEGWHSFLHS